MKRQPNISTATQPANFSECFFSVCSYIASLPEIAPSRLGINRQYIAAQAYHPSIIIQCSYLFNKFTNTFYVMLHQFPESFFGNISSLTIQPGHSSDSGVKLFGFIKGLESVYLLWTINPFTAKTYASQSRTPTINNSSRTTMVSL